jgi:hypothetical protein
MKSEEHVKKAKMMVPLLFVAGWVMAQTNPDRPLEDKRQITVQGCVSQSSGDFILMQSDPGNSYALESAKTINVGHYLGQEVKVTGTKSSTLGNSSDAGRSSVPSTTIIVKSISTIANECRL